MDSFYFKSKLMTGDRALSNIPHELKMKNASRPMVISERMEAYTPFYKAITSAFNNDKVKIASIKEYTAKIATTEAINSAIEEFKESGADSIVVVGRETVISIAKLVKLAIEQGVNDISKLDSETLSVQTQNNIPLYVVPVFYASGEEGINRANYYNDDTVYTFISDKMLPDGIVVDSSMSFRPGSSVMASSIMYALSMAIITYTSHYGNIVTMATAMSAIELICTNINKNNFKRQPVEYACNIATSTVLAGIAHNGLTHDDLAIMTDIVSREIKVPYSKTYSMLFPHYYEQIIDSENVSYMEVLLPIIGEETYAITPITKRAEQVVNSVRELINHLQDRTGFRYNLSKFGMTRDDIEPLVTRLTSAGIDETIARKTLERTL